MKTPKGWRDYALIDSGDGMKLEQWGKYTLARPDVQAIWPRFLPSEQWEKADATFIRKESGTGSWAIKNEIPDEWNVSYKCLSFEVAPASFKHTGLFPEQAVNWDYMAGKIENAGRPISALALFAYTGAGTLAMAKAGATVAHVDSSRGSIANAKKNQELSKMIESPISYFEDDALKFIAREQRRGKTYDVIVMDPPSYGRGTKGELWKLEKMLWPLMREGAKLLSHNPLFVMINTYGTSISGTTVANALSAVTPPNGTITSYEIGLAPKTGTRVLPAGDTTLWERK